jgi:sigma-B regulation protein RsbU (phosphoserine phosphatase)
MFSRMPYAVSLLLQILTLMSGTVFGSVAAAFIYPLFSLNEWKIVGTIVLTNAVIAVVVGISLHTYDSMRRQLELSFEGLREKEALQRELRIAHDVQQQLLPTAIPDVGSLELAAVCTPAVGVGGDYFDFLPLADGQIGLVIADVSGKGVPAALLMAGLQASVRSLALTGADPAELSNRVNQMLFHSSSAARYATMFLGFYDPQSRRLSYVNAGHLSPLVIGAGQVSALSDRGLPIGMFEDTEYETGTRSLTKGDLVALFTDGVVEAPNRHDEEFGEDRLVKLLVEQRGRALDEISAAIQSAIQEWSHGTEAHDDLTLVLARVR